MIVYLKPPAPCQGVSRVFEKSGGVGYPRPYEMPSHQTPPHPPVYARHSACPYHPREDLPCGILLAGDALYGYRARLLGALEQAGWLPVARVSDGVWQRARAEAHPEVLRGRYRIEQVFGSVKGAYGSYVGSRSWRGARVWVWGMLVLWNLVGLVQVGGDGVVLCLFVWLPRFFEHPLIPLTCC